MVLIEPQKKLRIPPKEHVQMADAILFVIIVGHRM